MGKTKSNLSKEFSKQLEQQINSIGTQLAEKPDNLLLRCVQLQDMLTSNATRSALQESQSFTAKEHDFLKKNKIAVMEARPLYSMGDFDGYSYEVKSFLPPWDKTFSDLAAKMKNITPQIDRGPKPRPRQ